MINVVDFALLSNAFVHEYHNYSTSSKVCGFMKTTKGLKKLSVVVGKPTCTLVCNWYCKGHDPCDNGGVHSTREMRGHFLQ